MTDYIEWFRIFITEHRSLEYIIIYFGVALGGEWALIPFAFLSAQGVFSVFALISLSFLGTLSSDLLWFSLGKTSFIKKIILHRYAQPTVLIFSKAMERISRGSRLTSLILAKFIFGTRALFIMYIGESGLSIKKFIYYNMVAVLLWLVAVIPIGFVSGLGFSYLAGIFNNIYVDIGIVLLILFIIVIISVRVEKKLITKDLNIEVE